MRNLFRNRRGESTGLEVSQCKRSDDLDSGGEKCFSEAPYYDVIDTIEGAQSQEVQHAFDEAAARLEGSMGSSKLSQEHLLLLYGLYKQATCGPCTTFRPSFFDIKARSKWYGMPASNTWPSVISFPMIPCQIREAMKVPQQELHNVMCRVIEALDHCIRTCHHLQGCMEAA